LYKIFIVGKKGGEFKEGKERKGKDKKIFFSPKIQL